MSQPREPNATVIPNAHQRSCSVETADCIFLFGAMLLSALPYIGTLGFYSDDWSYQATLARVSGESLAANFKALLASDSNMLVRPVQAIFLALEFRLLVGTHCLITWSAL